MSHSNLIDMVVPAYTGNYTKGRQKNVRCITIHHMAGVNSAEGCGGIFQRVGRNGSSHYGIGNDGRVGCYVEEEDTAWTNSNWNSNCESITIEVSNSATGGDWPVSDAAYNKLIKLVADIAKRNNLGTLVAEGNLTYHSMFTATSCPGPYLKARIGEIAAKANEINNPAKPEPTPTPTPTSGFLPTRGWWTKGDVDARVGQLADFMYKTFPAYTNKKALGNLYGPYLIASIKEFQRRTGLETDGNTGPITYAKLKEYGFNK